MPCSLSPSTTDEMVTHSAAMKANVAMQCEVSYLDLPLCVGYDDYGTPVVEVQPWPFLLPSVLVTWLIVKNTMVHIHIISFVQYTICLTNNI